MSVVLPTHNRALWLQRAIDCVLAQTHRELELIVIDDASTDATPQLLAGVRDPRVRSVRLEQNLGPGGARNQGLALARGDWVAFQDSDDIWQPHKLERQLAAAAQPGTVLVVTNNAVMNGYPKAFIAPVVDGRVHDVTERTLMWLPGASSWLAKRAALEAERGFLTDIWCHEDWELGLRLARRGRVLLVNDDLVTCDATPNSLFAQERSRSSNLKRVIAMHRSELAADPEAWSYYCNAVGQGEARFGDMREARKWFREARRARPLAPRAWANLAMSLAGRRAFAQYVRAGRWISAHAAALRHGGN